MQSVTESMVESLKEINDAEIDDVIEGSKKDTVWVYPTVEKGVEEVKKEVDETIDTYFINTRCSVKILDEGPIEIEIEGTI